MYVPFLDVFLGRGYVEHREMRVSFPYYLGPSTWTLFHTIAEISRSEAKGRMMIEAFKELLPRFQEIYPCPYCRHHMTSYVFQNKEPDLYPLEWTLLGPKPENGDISCKLEDKLATITNARSLRLFVWKLHNAVSSSIERQEEWYRRDDEALYTNRFWPSLESELSRAQILNSDEVPTTRLQNLYGTLKPSVQLGLLRKDVLSALQASDAVALQQHMNEAARWTSKLETALLNANMLSVNGYNADKVEANPAFTAEEEEYSSGGLFEHI